MTSTPTLTPVQRYRLAKKKFEKKQTRQAARAHSRLNDKIERKVQFSSKHRKIKMAKTYLTPNTLPGLSDIVQDPTLSGKIRTKAALMILDAGHGIVTPTETPRPRGRPRARTRT